MIWGATAATGGALLANQGLTGLWAKTTGVAFASNWSAALTAPVNEELLKAAGVVLIVLAAPRAIRGPLDGMIYGALVGLGFQVMENVTYSLNFIPLTGATDPGAAVALSAVLRVVLTGLGSHWAMTAVAGAGVGYLAARGLRGGALPAAACLAAAMGMHLLFDAPGPDLAILLKVLLNFAVVLALYLTLRRGHRARARAVLARHVAAGTVPASKRPTCSPGAIGADGSARSRSGLSVMTSSPVSWPRLARHSSGKRPTDRASPYSWQFEHQNRSRSSPAGPCSPFLIRVPHRRQALPARP